MIKKAISEEDLLKRYIKPELTEEAPEGFTSRVMSRISFETIPAAPERKSVKLITVPVVSVIVVLTLILMAILTSGDSLITFVAPELLDRAIIMLPDVNFSSILRINIPSTLLYVFIGLLFLSVFDRALHELFHREK